MNKAFALALFSSLLIVAAHADPVAVFDVQWGKKKSRQTRSFAIACDDAQAPLTSANFRKLVKDRFYVKTGFHRVYPNYLVQGGDPLSKLKDRTVVGTGGPGYALRPEIRKKHVRGAIAMGRLPDNVNVNRQSNGSQFYICLRPIPSEDGKDTVFGQVVSGLEALDEISRLPADSNANPLDKVEVRKTYLIDRSQLGTPVKVR
jgi:cyclophilin family peptidyl-prolyl cis-trans isomerase